MPSKIKKPKKSLFNLSRLKKPKKILRKRIKQKPVAFFKSKVNSTAYSFKEQENWIYKDRVDGKIKNKLSPLISNNKHLVLFDSAKKPRFSIQISRAFNKGILIYSIQRERTQYLPEKKFSFGKRKTVSWSSEKETQASKRFQKKLGMHPSEFLLSEFLLRNKNKIRKSIRNGFSGVYLAEEPFMNNKLVYKPLIERFFKKKKVSGKTISLSYNYTQFVYELSLNKKRVQEILGIKVDKKGKIIFID